MSINPVFCNIYLWFNLSTASFFLCVFVFYSVLLLVNSTLVIFVVPYEYSFCLLVKEINLLDWFPFAMHYQSFPWFALDFFLSFFSLSFLFFFPSPAHSFLLQTPGHFTISSVRITSINIFGGDFNWNMKEKTDGRDWTLLCFPSYIMFEIG